MIKEIKCVIKKIKRLFDTPFKKAIDQWFQDGGDERLRYDYDLLDSDIIFDVGGFSGDFSAEIYKRYQCNIFCFEPVGEFYEKIIKRFENIENINVFNIALSDRKGIQGISHEDDGSSLCHENVDNVDIEYIQTENIVDFINEQKVEEISLLKLNIEGAEYELLEELIKTGYISRIKYLQVQFHDVSEDSYKRMEKIWLELEKTHNLQWAYRPFVWESWKRYE